MAKDLGAHLEAAWGRLEGFVKRVTEDAVQYTLGLVKSHLQEANLEPVGDGIAPVLVLCNVTNKIRKRTDTAVAFTQEYSRVSYPLGNVSTLSMDSGSSKDTYTLVWEG